MMDETSAGKRLRLLPCSLVLAVGLAGCSEVSEVLDRMHLTPPALSTTTGVGTAISQLPPPSRPVDVAVYSFPDQTGQQEPNDNFSSFSNAVTQGGSAVLVDVLANSEWFNVIERTGVQNLLNERTLIEQTTASYRQTGQSPLPPLRFAGLILEGGIIDYDSNIVTGGAGARILGVGANTEYRQDRLTVALRAVSVSTGEVLTSVMTEKTVYSALVQGSVYRYVSIDSILELEAGYTRNEPVGLAVRQAIELAVFSLIMEGVKDGLWDFANPHMGARFLSAYEEGFVASRPSLVSPPYRSEPASTSGDNAVGDT